jgi:hypothetical protein
MAPHQYAVSKGGLKTAKDYELASYIIGAKYDLNPFIEDGDLADAQIQADTKRCEEIEDELRRIREGDPSHPIVRRRERAKLLTKMTAVIVEACKPDKEISGTSRNCVYKQRLTSIVNQLEVVSQKYTQAQQRRQELQRMCLDLYEIIEGETTVEQPQPSIEQLRAKAGSNGLMHKASEYDRLVSWLARQGGQAKVQEAISQAASVKSSLQTVGSIENLRTRVAQAASATPLSEDLDSEE